MFQAGLKRARTALALEAVAPAVAPAGVALRPALPPHLARRAFSVSAPARGIEEFLPPALKEGELPKGAGRAWEAAELRLKSQDDLHKLWFVCLKERNLLLTERLYYRQVGQAAPEPERLAKVKKTMARIKVVIGERARAGEALARDQRLLAGLQAAAKGEPAPQTAAPKPRLSGETVTFKRFGRKHTVPVELAPAKPTRQQRKVADKKGRYWARVRARRDALDAAEAAVGYKPVPHAAGIGSGGARGGDGAPQQLA